MRGRLAKAGVEINGRRPWDIRVHEPGWYARVLGGGSLALGESYMDGWWDCPALDDFFYRVMRAGLDKDTQGGFREWAALALARLLNRQSVRRAGQVARAHYDLGNDLFAAMLDRRLNYSCAYWEEGREQTLDQAQEAKLDMICRKLRLTPGMRLLDIGCGWGSLAQFAAERYGARVVGITVSQAQAELAAQRCQGLPVEIRLQDYRALEGRFDRVASVGMFEHVGLKNYHTYMQKAAECLSEDGLFLLHTIGRNSSAVACDLWISTYIFPNGMLPSPRQISEACEGVFVLEDWHGFGQHYDRTLMAWQRNFQAHWPRLKAAYDERFQRMWNYYLLSCAGAFRARRIQVWQIVLSKRGVEGGYARPG
jgi:cyclopropane-fatty-acyl-phospholipid synthase